MEKKEEFNENEMIFNLRSKNKNTDRTKKERRDLAKLITEIRTWELVKQDEIEIIILVTNEPACFDQMKVICTTMKNNDEERKNANVQIQQEKEKQTQKIYGNDVNPFKIDSTISFDHLDRNMRRFYRKFLGYINQGPDEGWTRVNKPDPRYNLWSLENDNSFILRTSCDIDVPAHVVLSTMTRTDDRQEMVWTETKDCKINIKTPDSNTEIIPGTRFLKAKYKNVKTGKGRCYELIETYIQIPDKVQTKLKKIAVKIEARRFFISQYTKYNKKSNEWILLAHSIKDDRFPCYPGAVDAKGFVGVRIICGDTDADGCNVTIVTDIHPGGNIPTWVGNQIIKWGNGELITIVKALNKMYKQTK